MDVTSIERSLYRITWRRLLVLWNGKVVVIQVHFWKKETRRLKTFRKMDKFFHYSEDHLFLYSAFWKFTSLKVLTKSTRVQDEKRHSEKSAIFFSNPTFFLDDSVLHWVHIGDWLIWWCMFLSIQSGYGKPSTTTWV